MNSFQPITTALDKLNNDYDWTHSFVREFYLTTSRFMSEFLDDSGHTQLGDREGDRCIRLIVAASGNPSDFGIEFMFRRVSVFSIQSLDELSFCHDYDVHAGHSIRFKAGNDDGECWINSESVFVRFLGKSYSGPCLILGYEAPNDDAYDAIAIESCWRQCTNCSNAWAENPVIQFCRCPDCGELTKLRI